MNEDWLRVAHLMGEQVDTVDGSGLLIACDTPSNGLYINWALASWTVWYCPSANNWRQKVYSTCGILGKSGDRH